jgi:Na+-translocating ferredoxin:NAD+ oxidoreductase RnfG subunit
MTRKFDKNKISGPLKIDRIMGVIAVVTIILAWIAGSERARSDVMPALKQVFPEAQRFEPVGSSSYTAWTDNPKQLALGYVKIASAMGYGGPVEVAVAVDFEGRVKGVAVVYTRDTPSFFNRVLKSDFFKNLVGKPYHDAFILNQDIDGVSGATHSSTAIAQSVRQGVRELANTYLGVEPIKEAAPRIQFGIPEIALIALFITGTIGRLKRIKYKKIVRWVSLLTGLIVLGIVYNIPLTVSMVNQLLLGFLPQWQNHIYWYLLIGGIVVIFVVFRKNPYCMWICPFGAAQECLGTIGYAKTRSPGRFSRLLKWLQRLLAWAVILIALLFRNPGLSSYEVFGTLFELVGSTIQFVLLGIVLVASLFVFRPWCNRLCPIRPIDDFFRMMYRWIIDSWQRLKLKKA